MVKFGLIASVLALAVVVSEVCAQESGDLFSGRWQQRADSVFIEFSTSLSPVPGSSLAASRADTGQKEAKIYRDDWNPGRVDMVHIYDIAPSGKNTWKVLVRLDPDAKPKPARLKFTSDTEFTLRTLSGRRQTLKYRKLDE